MPSISTCRTGDQWEPMPRADIAGLYATDAFRKARGSGMQSFRKFLFDGHLRRQLAVPIYRVRLQGHLCKAPTEGLEIAWQDRHPRKLSPATWP